MSAAAGTAIDTSARSSFTPFDQTMSEWRASLAGWRRSLSPSGALNYNLAARWDCHDLEFLTGRINFEQLGSQRSLALNSIPTRWKCSSQPAKMAFEQTSRAYLDSIDGRV
jgi:NTE family protein